MKKRTSKKKNILQSKINHKRSRSRSRRSRSFGTIKDMIDSLRNNENFKRFLIITILMLGRSAVKGYPYGKNIKKDITDIEYSALNILTVGSLLELMNYLFGKEITNNIMIGYLVISLGLDLSQLV